MDLLIFERPFATIFDIGGSIGDYAEMSVNRWKNANVISFEPLPWIARANRERARNRWSVKGVALSNEKGVATINACVNQPSASTMQIPGKTRLTKLGIEDTFNQVLVPTDVLDNYLHLVRKPFLVKIDVEGHEGRVIEAGTLVLDQADVIVIEIQRDPDIFVGSSSLQFIDGFLRTLGFKWAGVLDSFRDPNTRAVLQFDGVWTK